MMYPRLQLLKKFLCQDGAIFISIDDNENYTLRLLLNEIFGVHNHVATICWQKIYTVKNSARHLSGMHDYVALYARNKKKWKRNLRPRDASTDEDYSNPDDDPKGDWISHALQSRNYYSKGEYAIKCLGGRVIDGPPSGTYWRLSEENFWAADKRDEVWWGSKGNNNPRIKEYLEDAKDGVVPTTWWTYKYAGTNSDAKVALRKMIGDQKMFVTPKPVSLIRRIIELATDRDSIVLDSFAGSGTTGHAVLEQNKLDGGNRKFILVEIDREICRTVTRPRLEVAITGKGWVSDIKETLYENKLTVTKMNRGSSLIEEIESIEQENEGRFDRFERKIQDDTLMLSGITKIEEGLGGSVQYCSLDVPIFDEDGKIRNGITFDELAAHIYFSEIGAPITKKPTKHNPMIGSADGKVIYLLFNGVLRDRRPDGGNILTSAVLRDLPQGADSRHQKIIYGEGCLLGTSRLKRENIDFKQLPYEIKVS